MRLVRWRLLDWLHIGGVTVWPCVFVARSMAVTDGFLRHEGRHLEQQERWFRRGGPCGIALWFTLYLLVLPFVWNPWRRKWEREAYAAGERLPQAATDKILRRWPYLLWL